jgi:hypothetical protein
MPTNLKLVGWQMVPRVTLLYLDACLVYTPIGISTTENSLPGGRFQALGFRHIVQLRIIFSEDPSPSNLRNLSQQFEKPEKNANSIVSSYRCEPAKEAGQLRIPN